MSGRGLAFRTFVLLGSMTAAGLACSPLAAAAESAPPPPPAAQPPAATDPHMPVKTINRAPEAGQPSAPAAPADGTPAAKPSTPTKTAEQPAAAPAPPVASAPVAAPASGPAAAPAATSTAAAAPEAKPAVPPPPQAGPHGAAPAGNPAAHRAAQQSASASKIPGQTWMGTSTTLAVDWAAKSKVLIDKERAAAEARDQGSIDDGIPDNHPLVRDLLATHKDEELMLCVAGCGPEPKVVGELPAVTTEGHYTASASDPGKAVDAPSEADVLCVAGCGKSRMQVVYRNSRP